MYTYLHLHILTFYIQICRHIDIKPLYTFTLIHMYIWHKYTYIHLYLYTHIHTEVFTYISIYIYTYMCVRICIDRYTCNDIFTLHSCMKKYSYRYQQLNIYTYLHINIYTNKYLHVYIYTYLQIHIYIYIFTYLHI